MKPPHLLALASLTASSLLFTPIAAAQTTDDFESVGYPHTQPIALPDGSTGTTAFAGGGHFESVEVMDFDGDGALDAVALDAGYLVVGKMIDTMTLISAVESSPGVDLVVNDFATFDGKIATVGYEGLEIYAYNPTNEAFERTNLFTTGFEDDLIVCAADWDNDGDMDLVTLDDTRTDVDVLINDGAAGWSSGLGRTLPLAADDILPIQWDSGTSLELAVTDAVGVSIYEQALPIATYTRGSNSGPGSMARVQSDSATDELAWAVGPLAGSYYLITMSEAAPSGGVLDVMPILGGVPLALSSGTYNTDDDFDLGLTYSDSADVSVFENNGDGTFSSGSSQLFEWSQQQLPIGQVNRAAVAFADLDMDGNQDVVLASGVHLDLELAHNHLKAAYSSGAPLHGFLDSTTETTVCLETDASSDEWLHLNAEIGLVAASGQTIVDVEVTTWIQDSPTDYVDPVALSKCTPTWSSIQTNANELDVLIDASVLDAPSPGADSRTIVHVLVRPLNSGGTLAGDPIQGSFVTYPADIAVVPAADSWGAGAIYFDNFNCGSTPTNGATLGGWQGKRRLGGGLPPGLPPVTSGAPCRPGESGASQ